MRFCIIIVGAYEKNLNFYHITSYYSILYNSLSLSYSLYYHCCFLSDAPEIDLFIIFSC